MDKGKSYLLHAFVSVLVVFLFAVPGLTHAGSVAQPITIKPAVPLVKPAAPLVNPNIPAGDGQITGVTASPAGLWYTGSSVQIQWQWPNYVNFAADVTLWNGTRLAETIVTGWNKTSVGWNVPLTLSPGSYTIRVQSSKNSGNRSEAAVRVEYSTLTVLSPTTGQTLTAGSPSQVVWSYQGKPGPLKLELVPAGGTTAQLIATDVPWGNLGGGAYNWLIPAAINAGSYQIQATSTGNSLITARSKAFTVQKLGTIGIVVADPSNAAISGATVTTTVNGAARSVTTQSNGQAMFDKLPAGTYTFKATSPGYAPDGPAETKVVLASGASQSAMIRLKRGQGKVVVTVRDDTNKPIPGIVVTVGSGSYPSPTTTRADGTATWDFFPTGTWPVNASAFNYNRNNASPHYVDANATLTVNPGATTTITVNVLRYGWAYVTVTDGTMPAYNVYVCDTSNLNPSVHVGCIYKTDATGLAKVELKPGVNALQAWSDDYQSTFFSLSVTSGGTTYRTITVKKAVK